MTSSTPTMEPEDGHLLLQGGTVLTMDPGLGELSPGDVEITNGTITALGRGLEAPGATVIDASDHIVLPGFVDTHWHLWGTLLRGVVGDGEEHGWFARKRVLGPHFTPDDMHVGVRLGLADAIGSGITTVHDWAHNVISEGHADANLDAHRPAGVRIHFSYGAPSTTPGLSLDEMRQVMASAGVSVDEPMDFEAIAAVRERALARSGGLLTFGVNVRGPARSAPEVYREEWAQARSLAMPLAMHCAGTRAEVAKIRQVEILDSEGLLGPDVLLAHCLYISERERAMAAAASVPITVSPLSSLRLAMGFPPIGELEQAGISVSLSLDTTAISANADVFQAMRVASGLEAARHRDPEALPPRRVLEMATLAGATALGLGEVTGSLTPGKRADVILVRTDRPNMAPVVDPAVALVHSAQPADVDTVIVDGRIRKRSGQLTWADPGELAVEAAEALAALCERAGFDAPASR